MKIEKINWIITDDNITLNYNGQTHIIARDNKYSNDIIFALKEVHYDEIPELISMAERIKKMGHGHFEISNGNIYIDGMLAPPVLGEKIMQFANEGLPYQPLLKFANNLQLNPSFRSVKELFKFLEKNNHPLTENGCFIAYKAVGSDFKDLHTHTMDNSVGLTVEMPRNQVNEDPNQTCSNGLHVANWDYAHNVYGAGRDSIMLEVEVNPADVVAVPVDYDSAKMRVCKYKVISVVDKENSNSSLRKISQEENDLNEKDLDEEFNEDEEFDEDIA
jgi:hypothetical protein